MVVEVVVVVDVVVVVVVVEVVGGLQTLCVVDTRKKGNRISKMKNTNEFNKINYKMLMEICLLPSYDCQSHLCITTGFTFSDLITYIYGKLGRILE